MPNYSKMTDKVNNRKIQVESAVRDGEGNKISTRYITSDGYYPQLGAGFADLADNLTPYSDNSAISQEHPFVFQSSAKGSDIGSYSLLKELRGNTIKWNQLGRNGNFTNTDYWSSTNSTISASDNVLTFEVTNSLTNPWDASVTPDYYGQLQVVYNHIYLMTFEAKLVTGGTALSFGFNAFTSTGANVRETATINADNFVKCSIIRKFEYEGHEGRKQTPINFSTLASIGDSFQLKNFMLFDLTLMFGAGNEPTSVLEFNRLFPLPYYDFNVGQLLSSKSNKLINVGFNAFDGVLEMGGMNDTTGQNVSSTRAFRTKNYIEVIPGETYKLDLLNRTNYQFTNGLYLYKYDGNHNFIGQTWLTNSNAGDNSWNTRTQFTLEYNVQYIRFLFNNYPNDTSYTGAKVCVHLIWNHERDGEYEDYEKHEYDLPDVELRSVGSVYDSITPDGTYTQRIDVRAYESGDENDSSVLTDLTNTYYVLSTPVITTVNSYTERQDINDFGTQEFVSSQTIQVPQGNLFSYPVDYKAFIDSVGSREDIDYNASQIVSHTELTNALSNIPTPSMNDKLDTSFSGVSEYNSSSTYTSGNKCWYNGKIYVATDTTTGTFDNTKWTEITLSEYVDLTSVQAITGNKTFSGSSEFTNSIRTQHIRPRATESYDLGSSTNKFRDLYLSGIISDGTNSVSIADLAALISYAKGQGWIQ